MTSIKSPAATSCCVVPCGRLSDPSGHLTTQSGRTAVKPARYGPKGFLCCVVLCCVVLCCAVLCCVVLCCVALRCVALRCVALRCAALRCAALRCAVLCCVVLCCVVLCCVVLCGRLSDPSGHLTTQSGRTAVKPAQHRWAGWL